MEDKRLKTLKEVMEQYPDVFGGTGTGEFILKDVAKEWIKELESNNSYYSVGLNNRNLINWIEHFFNLE